MRRFFFVFTIGLFLSLAVFQADSRVFAGSELLSATRDTKGNALRRSPAEGVPVLLYHSVSSDVTQGRYGVIALSLFRKQLDYLKQEGYVTIGLDALYDSMVLGKRVPEKAIVLSFDDTNESDYTLVFPELKKRGFKGVFFTVGSKAEEKKWKKRLSSMNAEGMEIASHTMNHRYSGGGPSTKGRRTEVDDAKTITYELMESKRVLEGITGSKVDYLAWPGDSYTDSMIKMAQKAGYKGLLMAKTERTGNVMQQPHLKSGFNKLGDDVLHIRRITIHGADSMEDFKSLLKDGIYPRP
jgi:peptidoglycan/xylan/chitin deacetylase (PgdA/CDA1 family)